MAVKTVVLKADKARLEMPLAPSKELEYLLRTYTASRLADLTKAWDIILKLDTENQAMKRRLELMKIQALAWGPTDAYAHRVMEILDGEV